jgi:hypothetical protein
MWIKSPVEISSESLSEKVAARIARGEFEEKDLNYISNYQLALLKKTLSIPDKQLELLREVAKKYDVKLKAADFTSHRPFIGPVIVALKKAVSPFVRAILGETLNSQRAFNAAVVEFLTSLHHQEEDQEELRKINERSNLK